MIISRKEIEARENTEKTIKAHITIKKLLWRNALRLDWERNSYLVQFRVSRGVSRCGEWAKHKKNKSSSSIRELQYCAIRKAERSVHSRTDSDDCAMCSLAAAVVEMNCACTSYGRVFWSVSFRVHWVSCSCSFISFHMVHAHSRLHDTFFSYVSYDEEGKYNNLIFLCAIFFFVTWMTSKVLVIATTIEHISHAHNSPFLCFFSSRNFTGKCNDFPKD